MGSGGTLWENLDTISETRMNQKTTFISSTEPTTLLVGMLWLDPTNELAKFRNADNDDWIPIGIGSGGINYAPTGIEFGSSTQEYDIDGTTWVSAVAGGTLGGIPDESSSGHHLSDCLDAIESPRDSSYLAVREKTGAPSATNPLTVQFLFSDVDTFDVIKVRSYYVGSLFHNMSIQLWNYTTSSFDTFTTFSGESGYIDRAIVVFGSTNYVSSGNVILQYIHTSSGTATHRIEFDYVVLGTGAGSGGTVLASAVQYTPPTGIFTGLTNVQTVLDTLSDTYIDQAVRTTSSPTFVSEVLNGVLTLKETSGSSNPSYLGSVETGLTSGLKLFNAIPRWHFKSTDETKFAIKIDYAQTGSGGAITFGYGASWSGPVLYWYTTSYLALSGSFLISGAIQSGSHITPSNADSQNLGSTSNEWHNLYIGDTGYIYLGSGQDTSIRRSASNILTINASSGVVFDGNITISGSTGDKEIRVLNTGSGQSQLLLERSGGTAALFYIYLPSGSTDLRFYSNVADRFVFTQAGDMYLNGATSDYLHGVGGIAVGGSGTYGGISFSSSSGKDILIYAVADVLKFYHSGATHGAGSDKFTFNMPTGYFTTPTGIYIVDSNSKLSEGSGNAIRITTDSGYVDIGPQNTSYCHIYTDRAGFYFNAPIGGSSGVYVEGYVRGSSGFKSSDGSAGWTGTFTDYYGLSVTVKDGIVTNVA